MSQDLPELFEEDTESLWPASKARFNEAEARRIQVSYKVDYPGEHAIITPAHHIYALMEVAGLIPEDPLCHYPTSFAKP